MGQHPESTHKNPHYASFQDSSRKNKNSNHCSAENAKAGTNLGLASQRWLASYDATRSAQRTRDSERRTANGERNEACGRARRGTKERSPHCGTGVLARRFAFAGCEIF